MTKKSRNRINKDKRKVAQSAYAKVEQQLGKEMLLSLVGYLVEKLGGEVKVAIPDLAKPRDLGMAKDAEGRLVLASWEGNFSQQMEEIQKERASEPKGPDPILEAGTVSITPVSNVSPILCPHARPSNEMCPHCLGINTEGR
jgi:hypothetical protein